jgi:hypothetical protein
MDEYLREDALQFDIYMKTWKKRKISGFINFLINLIGIDRKNENSLVFLIIIKK